MSWRYSACFVVHLPEHTLREHLREAEDRVQRRPELVGHVGQELRLVAARGLELLALVRDLAEESGVLDGESGLGGERAEQPDDLWCELARYLARDGQDPDDLVLTEQGHPEQRPVPGVD